MQIHIVQKGDTLYQLAQEYGVNLDTLIRMNPQITDPDMLMPGVKVQIPSERMPIEEQPNPNPSLKRTEIKKEESNGQVRPMEDIQLDEQKRGRTKQGNERGLHHQKQENTLRHPRLVRPHKMPQTSNQQMVPNTIVYYCCCCKNHASFMEQMNPSYPSKMESDRKQGISHHSNDLKDKGSHQPYGMQGNETYFHEKDPFYFS